MIVNHEACHQHWCQQNQQSLNMMLCDSVNQTSAFSDQHHVEPLALSRLRASMENIHPLCRTPFHADALNSSCRGTPNSAHKKLRLIYGVHLRKIFCWPFFKSLRKFCWPFFGNLTIFVELFWQLIDLFLLLWIFSWHFWASFTSHVRREFRNPNAPSSAQAILCRTHSEILGAITLLCQTYSA